jgi:hypothetical protein
MCSVPLENDQRPIVSQKKSPAEAGDFVAPSDQRNSRIRMMRGIGIPMSQSRMGM